MKTLFIFAVILGIISLIAWGLISWQRDIEWAESLQDAGEDSTF